MIFFYVIFFSWIVRLKDKRGFTIVNAFQIILDISKRKPKKIWIDQGIELYDNAFKKSLKYNDIEMYSTYNEWKSIVAETFIRTFKNMIYKHMTAVSKNVYFDVLDYIVDKYHNTYHKIIKMKHANVKSYSYTEYNVDSNDDYPRFKVGNHVGISKYKNIFSKGYAPNWSEEILVISKIKNAVPSTYIINDLNGEEIVGTLCKD